MKMNELTKYCLELADDTEEAVECLKRSTQTQQEQQLEERLNELSGMRNALREENNKLREKVETLKAKIDQLLGAEHPEQITHAANDASVSYNQLKGLLRTWSDTDVTFTALSLASYFGCSRVRITNMLKSLRATWSEFDSLYKMEGTRRSAKYVSRKHVPRVTRLVAMGTPSGQAVKLEGSD